MDNNSLQLINGKFPQPIDLMSIFLKNKIDYNKIKSESEIILFDEDEYDINFIIGCRGRVEFMPPLIDSIKSAIENSTYKITITVVEHSALNEHKNFCVDNRINYINTKGNYCEQYSRSFAYNFGFLYSNKSKYYIMHDLDILIKNNFFNELEENLNNNAQCMQTYGKRRVLYLDFKKTLQVINKKIDFNNLSEGSPGVSLPMFNGMPALGSKGGSIIISHDLFKKVGGFDPEIFWGYAAEDQFFWNKVEQVDTISYADNPPIDMFHMWHEPSHTTNPLLILMEALWIEFRDLDKSKKLKIIEAKKELLSQ